MLAAPGTGTAPNTRPPWRARGGTPHAHGAASARGAHADTVATGLPLTAERVAAARTALRLPASHLAGAARARRPSAQAAESQAANDTKDRRIEQLEDDKAKLGSKLLIAEKLIELQKYSPAVYDRGAAGAGIPSIARAYFRLSGARYHII